MTSGHPGPARRAARHRRHSSAPGLPLELPPPPALPGGIAPEASTPCAEPFDDPEWRFSVDWDGARTLVYAGDGAVRLQDERLRDVTALFPEVVAAVRATLQGRAGVLDGVVAVLDPQGRPDLEALAARRAGPVGRGAPPVVLLATDLLHLDGVPLMARRLDRRLEALAALPPGAAHLQVPEWVVSSGHAFAAAAAERGLAAIVARHAGAPYRPGVASPDRLRIAIEERADAVVVGTARDAAGSVVSLVLAELTSGRLAPAGRAGVAWPEPVARRFERLAASSPADGPPPSFPPVDATGVRWIRPELCVTVRHHGRAQDGGLRLASVVALREDRDPAWCVRREPVPAPVAVPAGGFVPTVLSTLPFDS